MNERKLAEYQRIIDNYGPWSAHNIKLGEGLYTMGSDFTDRAQKRAKVYHCLIEKFIHGGVAGKKVLDLGCLEGGISLYLAAQGAMCTGIDIRESHLEKAKFASKCLSLDNRCTWIHSDIVEKNTWNSLNNYDVIICSGILYHMDVSSIVPLLTCMRNSSNSDGMTIVDTNIVVEAKSCHQVDKNLMLYGSEWIEHIGDFDPLNKVQALWSSWKNSKAFWLTERSLTNSLVKSGYEGVFKPLYPYHEWGHQTRDIWLALPTMPIFSNLPLRNEPDKRPISHPGMK